MGDERLARQFDVPPPDDVDAQARRCVLGITLDDTLSALVDRADERALSPWLLCYAAMRKRFAHDDLPHALRLARSAHLSFMQHGDLDGQARALAEIGLIRYHLGQRTTALTELNVDLRASHPACIAALSLAIYVNALGVDDLPQALAAIQHGLQSLDHDPDIRRRATWRVVLQRNVAPAYHYNGQLVLARAAIEDALRLVDLHELDARTKVRTLYEAGLLEQRAGRLYLALEHLEQARTLAEQSPSPDPFWRWIVAAEGRALRDLGQLDAAEARYHEGGWGEGDEGPLWLWLLQGRYNEARVAAEALRRAAHAVASPVEVANAEIFFALLDLEAGATPAVAEQLRTYSATHARLQFWYYHASTYFHLATTEYALGNDTEGDQALAAALAFGAQQGYLNFYWWHPERMRALLHRALAHGIEVEYSRLLLHERALEEQPAIAIVGPAPAAQTLALRCLGRFEVEIDGEPLPSARWQGHAGGALRMQRLLLFLARHREPQPLRTIARYVWPDRSESFDVSSNFHMTLSGLRRVLEPELQPGASSRFVLTTPLGYQLHPDLDIVVDLDRFETHMRQAKDAVMQGDLVAARTAYQHMAALYGGPLVFAKIDPIEAETYHHAAMHALRWLAADALAHDQPAQALVHAQRLVREDRWDHVGWRLLIETYMAQGNRRAARRQYLRYRKLHDDPDEAVLQLARRYNFD